MRMLRWTCRITKLDKIRNERINGSNESGGNRKESPGKEVDMVGPCDTPVRKEEHYVGRRAMEM